MKILFIGGYGNISWWCTKKAIDAGHDVYLLNREETMQTRRDIPKEAQVFIADYRDSVATENVLKNHYFDVVCDFICYNAEHAEKAVKIFTQKTKQYVFISSESVYQRLTSSLPFAENAPKYDENKVSSYIGGKLRAEKVFINAYEKCNFPVTIVRPGYTYDTIVPVSIGHNCFTVPQRCLDGKPLYIAGEGNNLYTFTNSRDFAGAFYYLLGNKKCIGEDYNISDSRWLTWNEASDILLDVLKVKKRKIIHIPFDDVLRLDLPQTSDLMYQRMMHSIIDISKIKNIVPNWNAEIDFRTGLQMTMQWLYEDPAHRRIVPSVDEQMNKLDYLYADRENKET